MTDSIEITQEQKDLIKKINETIMSNSAGFSSYIAVVAENSSTAIELNQVLSENFNRTGISLGNLIESSKIKGGLCSTKTMGGFLGVLPSAIALNDAINTDLLNNRFDDTPRTALKIIAGTAVGALLMPFVVGTSASAGMAAVGAALIYYMGSLTGDLVDEAWNSSKDFLQGYSDSLEAAFNDFRNQLSSEQQLIFDQCAIPLITEMKTNFPTQLNDLQNKLQTEYPSELEKTANLLGLDVCPIPSGPKETMTKLFNTAEVTRSPLVVDLDGDGVETIGQDGQVYFDHDGNGFAEKSGWVGKDDGILVRDINNNGKIDDGTELFGNNSVLSNGKKAENGFEALKDLDSNHDGVFNSSDAKWNEVKVWKDSNGNGFVDDGELLTLEQANISGINLNYANQSLEDVNGNQHLQTGTIIKTDGSSATISDVWFTSDVADTVDRSDVEIPEVVKALPNVEGMGNVHDLWSAMALDTSGELKTLVEQYAAETNVEARNAILTNLIYHWAGVQDMDPNGRNPAQFYGNVLGDSRKLEALEEFLGKNYMGVWCWGELDPNPHGQAAPLLLQAFDELKTSINHQLLAQTHYKEMFDSISLTYDSATGAWQADIGNIVETFRAVYNANVINGYSMLRELSGLLVSYGEIAQSVIEAIQSFGNTDGMAFENLLFNFGDLYNLATDGDDILTGNNLDNIMMGYAGNDRLFGNDGNDVLNGGAGNDYLNGGNGADTYVFEAGFGNDTIDNTDDDASSEHPDIIQFGEGILVANTKLERQGFDLIIKVSYEDEAKPTDSICVLSYFDRQGTTSTTVNQINFADGTSWNYEYIIANWDSVVGLGGGVVIEGTDDFDPINGATNGDNLLIGNGGDDRINGGYGNDIIIGGPGDDDISGFSGDDTYVYNLGDGLDCIYDSGNHDKIVFGKGINFEDLSFRCENRFDLRIIINGDETQGMLIKGFYYNDNKIEDIVFADGKVIHLANMGLTFQQKDIGESIYGTGYDDIIYGNGGDDIINAGEGNDIVHGGDGNDQISALGDSNILFGDAGDDDITGSVGKDTLIGGTGNDTLYGYLGDDTYIYNLGDGLDTVIDNGGFDTLQFGEGISKDDLIFRVEGKNLQIVVKNDDTQGIIIKNFFDTYPYDVNKIDKIQFADGFSLPLSAMGLELHQTSTINGTGLTDYDDVVYLNDGDNDVSVKNGNNIVYGGIGNDRITAGSGNDIIYGGDGDDTIYAGNGANIIIGGKGNDTIGCGDSDDTYIYNLGDGLDSISDQDYINPQNHDIIRFGEGISRDNLSFSKEGDDYKIIINNDEAQGIAIRGMLGLWSSGYCDIEELQFADGSSIGHAEMLQLVQAMSSFGAEKLSGVEQINASASEVNELYNLAPAADLKPKAA